MRLTAGKSAGYNAVSDGKGNATDRKAMMVCLRACQEKNSRNLLGEKQILH